jgi:glycosyltransferase involved in cell wall biosynthesis
MVAEENLPYVARQDDELGFRDSLRSLIDDANLREKLGRANRAIALARFDRAQMAARYLELFG